MKAARGIFIGGSAGALDGLRVLLAALPGGFPIPVAVVVHVPEGPESALPEVLARATILEVREVTDKDAFVAGVVHVAPPGYHLLVDDGPTLALSVDEPVNHARPSIDVLFVSAAEVLGADAVAVVLSGANEDGAEGAARVQAGGGRVYVEAPSVARHAQMPASAVARCPDAVVGTAAEIAGALARLATEAA